MTQKTQALAVSFLCPFASGLQSRFAQVKMQNDCWVCPLIKHHPAWLEVPLLSSNMMTCLCPTPGAELAISVRQDPFVHPSVVPSCSLHYLLSTLHPLLTFIETTKDSLSKATEAEVPCLLDRGSDDCNDDGLVISGFGSGKHSSLTCPPTDDEDLCPSFLLVKIRPCPRQAFKVATKLKHLRLVDPTTIKSSGVVEVPIPAHP